MRHPQILVYERDGRLARLLEQTSPAHGWTPKTAGEERAPHWSLREPRQVDACLRLLNAGGPSLLVVAVGTRPEQELTLVERVHWLFPDTGIVVVGQTDDEALARMAWDLGATCVLFPPLSVELLPAVAAQWMNVGSAGGMSTSRPADTDRESDDGPA